MKASENNLKSNWFVRILLWLNILVSAGMFASYLATHISPADFAWFAFFGLSYPVWLLFTLIFLVLWLFIKRKWMLIPAITLLLGFNHLRHFVAFTLIQPDLIKPVKIMSFNVKIFNLYDLENRTEKRNGIFQFLKDENPEIICFQEFYHQEGGKEFVTKDTMVKILEMDYYHERYTHKMLDEKYFGVATFSKYPIISKGEIPFSNDKNNFCIYSDIVIEKDTVRVFNAHIGSIRFQQDDYELFDENAEEDRYADTEDEKRIVQRLKSAFEKRALQIETIMAEVEKSPYPVIFCGDVNDTPVSYCYRQLNNQLNDAFVESGNGIGRSYIGKMPANRIDYIFHSPSVISANFTTHDVEFSDHSPISCEVDIN
ncbi:MAG: endonuclease/exonuclease/phosphatase family protein [Crocinitomicaceae bacterium]|nr:endonuclease/exonuclease/phosphatase family protein [Crocinitomicaceae bacterium]